VNVTNYHNNFPALPPPSASRLITILHALSLATLMEFDVPVAMKIQLIFHVQNSSWLTNLDTGQACNFVFPLCTQHTPGFSLLELHKQLVMIGMIASSTATV